MSLSQLFSRPPQAALDLLLDLMAADGGCLREGARLLTAGHFQGTGLETLWNYQPQSTARCAFIFVETSTFSI